MIDETLETIPDNKTEQVFNQLHTTYYRRVKAAAEKIGNSTLSRELGVDSTLITQTLSPSRKSFTVLKKYYDIVITKEFESKIKPIELTIQSLYKNIEMYESEIKVEIVKISESKKTMAKLRKKAVEKKGIQRKKRLGLGSEKIKLIHEEYLKIWESRKKITELKEKMASAKIELKINKGFKI